VLNSVQEAKEKSKNHAADFGGKISLAALSLLLGTKRADQANS
jgi:hypothetical protein